MHRTQASPRRERAFGLPSHSIERVRRRRHAPMRRTPIYDHDHQILTGARRGRWPAVELSAAQGRSRRVRGPRPMPRLGWTKPQVPASYARGKHRMNEAEKSVQCIRARPLRRIGELLEVFKQIERRPSPEYRVVTVIGISRAEGGRRRRIVRAASEITAGLIANVDEEEFEKVVESDAPPSATMLAEMGRRPGPEDRANHHINGSDARRDRSAREGLAVYRCAGAARA